jgi:hypothetical protein
MDSASKVFEYFHNNYEIKIDLDKALKRSGIDEDTEEKEAGKLMFRMMVKRYHLQDDLDENEILKEVGVIKIKEKTKTKTKEEKKKKKKTSEKEKEEVICYYSTVKGEKCNNPSCYDEYDENDYKYFFCKAHASRSRAVKLYEKMKKNKTKKQKKDKKKTKKEKKSEEEEEESEEGSVSNGDEEQKYESDEDESEESLQNIVMMPHVIDGVTYHISDGDNFICIKDQNGKYVVGGVMEQDNEEPRAFLTADEEILAKKKGFLIIKKN